MPRRLLTLGALLALFAGASVLRSSANRGYFAAQRFEDVYYLPPSEWLVPMSLGYREAGADFVFMKALVYYGTGIGERVALRHVAEYADAAFVLDPDFLEIQRWSTTWVAYQAQAAPVEDLERIAAMLAAAEVRHPDHGELAWWAGSFYAYEVAMRHPARSEARRTWQQKGYVSLARAARLGAGPKWLALANASALSRLGQREQAIRHLEEMTRLTTDPRLRREALRRLARFRQQNLEESADVAVQELERAWRADYPYLDLALYELVGRRRRMPSTPLRP